MRLPHSDELTHRRPAKDAASGVRGHLFLFVGGLPRSGTTFLAALFSSLNQVSMMSFAHLGPEVYEMSAPWLLANNTREQFESAVHTGGIEGKFVQNEYRYVNIMRDISQGGTLDSLVPNASAASQRTAEQLFHQWAPWWDTRKPVLVEKSPENFLMGPFLHGAFGKRASLVFVMRHPLVWALASEKWVKANSIALRTVEQRIVFWFASMSKLVDSLHGLRNPLVVQLEIVGTDTAVQTTVIRRALCKRKNLANIGQNLSRLGVASTLKSEVLSHSLAYVTCWLGGKDFDSNIYQCMPRKRFYGAALRSYADELSTESVWRLHRMSAHHELQANQFGYSFQAFTRLTLLSRSEIVSTRLPINSTALETAKELGVASNWSAVVGALRAALVVPPWHKLAPPPATVSRLQVLVVFHQLVPDPKRPTGMDARYKQIIHSLLALQMHVHLVCHCYVQASQLSPHGASASVYEGSMEKQIKMALSAATIKAAFVFFTTITT